MLSIYRTLSLRYLSRRWFRALLIVASIALGVATLVATQALIGTMTKAGLRASNPLAGKADLLISGGGNSYIDLSWAEKLANVEGVKAAYPRVFTKVKVKGAKETDEKQDALLVGIDILSEDPRGQGVKITYRNHVDHEMVMKLLEEMKTSFMGVSLDEGFAKLDFNTKKKLIDAGTKILSGLDLTATIQVANDIVSRKAMVGLVGNELRQKYTDQNKLINVYSLEKRKKKTSPTKPNSGSKTKQEKEPPTFQLFQVGTVDASGPMAALGGNTIIVEINWLNQLMGWKGKATRIDIVLETGANRQKVQERIRAVVNGRVEVHTPEESNEMIQNVFSGMHTGFSLSGVAALVVGLFLVYNVLRFSVAERRHEIGIMLSVGATRKQVILLFAGEALVLGLIGSLLGIPLGLGLAQLSLQPVQDVLRDIFMELEAKQVEVSPQVMLIAVAAGVFTGVAAALLPALAAARENPAEAVRKIPPKPTWQYFTLQVGASAMLIVIGTVAILLRHLLPDQVGTFGGLVFVLLGTLVATPLLAILIALMMQPFIRAVVGVEGRLAADNLVRSASRTGIVIAALASGVALVTQTAGIIRSNSATLSEWIKTSIDADLFVTAGSPVGASSVSDVMPETLAKELEKVPGVERAIPLKPTRVTFRDKIRVYLMAADTGGLYEMAAKRGRDKPLLKQLSQQRRKVVMSENFGKLHRVKVGDTITLPSGRGPVEFAVIGTIEDYTWNLGSLLIDRRDYLTYWGDDKVEIYHIFLKDETQAQLVQEQILKKVGAENALVVLTRAELQTRILDMINRIYNISYGQLIVVMCVAALGVITALLISVLQRRREMGLLRAIGASRNQVVLSVLAEAMLMGIIGTIIGLIVGIPMEWYALNVVMREEFGYSFALHIPWLEALFIAAAAVFLATLAGLGPALYAVRQRIPEAIAYE